MHKVNIQCNCISFRFLECSFFGFSVTPVLSWQQAHQIVSTPHPSTQAVYLHSCPFSLFDRQWFFQLTLPTLGSSTAQRAEGSGAEGSASNFTAEGLVQAVLRKQERWDILLLFWSEIRVHITLHQQSKLFSTAILSLYLRSDLANYSVAFLYKAFIFCIASQKWPRKAESGQRREALTQSNLQSLAEDMGENYK